MFSADVRNYTVLANITINTPQGSVYRTPANVVLRVPQDNPTTAVIRNLSGIWGSLGKIRLSKSGARTYEWRGYVLSGRYAGGYTVVRVSI